MNAISRIGRLATMSLATIPERPASSAVIVIGIAAVVGVLVAVASIAQGLSETMLATGKPDRVIVLRTGAESEAGSTLSLESARLISSAAGIARTADDRPAASADLLVPVHMPRRVDGTLAGLTVRGVQPEEFQIRPEIRIVAGRRFEFGVHEAIVGKAASAEFRNLRIGDRITLRNSQWTIVGTFESGDVYESAILVDVSALSSAYHRALVSSVSLKLASPASFEALKQSLTTEPQLSVDVLREPDYYKHATEGISLLFSFIANVVAGIMAIGALFAAVNTMYAAVRARAGEIAVLRALGFGPAGVVASVLLESLLLALMGAILGAAVAWLLLSGTTISMGSTQAATVFRLQVTGGLFAVGATWGCVLGLIGGLLPAIRAARLPVAVVLRQA
jgi:putative ABC transport system permease protein